MKKQLLSLILIVFTSSIYSQESSVTYKKALEIITNSPEYKKLGIEQHTLSKQSISFINSAYAFYLDQPYLAFIEYDFENYFGELYIPININEFEALRDKKRAQHILYVSETEQDHFIIDLLSFKRKKRSTYPKFYNGVSYSYLFKKESNGTVTYLRTLKIMNQ